MVQNITFKDESRGVNIEVEVIGLWGQKEIDWVRKAVTKLPTNDQEILIAASNRVKNIEYYREKESSFFGRISNRITGENIYEIETTGVELTRLHQLANQDPEYTLIPHEEYMAKYEEYKELLILATHNTINTN